MDGNSSSEKLRTSILDSKCEMRALVIAGFDRSPVSVGEANDESMFVIGFSSPSYLAFATNFISSNSPSYCSPNSSLGLQNTWMVYKVSLYFLCSCLSLASAGNSLKN